ncbi:MAG: hypothetical protein IPN08_15965 [Bacteroidales bacterium]|nr:hypothetical protein [Bacteroidales bacterium]
MNRIALIFILAALFNGCVTFKPDSASVSQKDYNQRVDVSSAHFDKVLTPAGKASFAVGAIAGGVVGYTLADTKYGSNENPANYKKGSPIVGGIIGAFTGFTATYLINKALGLGKVRRPETPEEWISRANSRYVLLKANNVENFRIVDGDVESSWTVKNIQDARDFSTAFKSSSSYANNVCKQTLYNSGIYRKDYIELLRLYPENSSLMDMKLRFIDLSTSVFDLYAAADLYPEANVNVEDKSTEMIAGFEDAKRFNSRYPKSQLNKKVIIKALDNSSAEEVSKMPPLFKSDFNLTEKDFQKYPTTDNGKRNYLNSQFILKPARSFSDVEFTYYKYKWLNYANKPTDILNRYWNIGYTTFYDGDDLIAFIKRLSYDPEFSIWNISRELSNNFLQEKLAEEVRGKVTVTVEGQMGNNNPEWENWLNNTEYSAGIVNDESNIDFVVYGLVKNNSNFSLPVKIDVNAKMYLKETIQGTGTWTNALLSLAEAVTGQKVSESTRDGGTASESYFVPEINRGESLMYAVVLDYGESTRYGINAFDLYKFTQEIGISDVSTQCSFNDLYLSQATIEKQEIWQNFARYGIPNANLIDAWRNVEYSDNEWQEKKVEIQEARRRAWQEAIAESRNESEKVSTNDKCWVEVYPEVNESDWDICGFSVTLYEITCIDEDGDESTHFFYYWDDPDGNDCGILSGGSGYYEEVLGFNSYLGDDGLEAALRDLCDCEKD